MTTKIKTSRTTETIVSRRNIIGSTKHDVIFYCHADTSNQCTQSANAAIVVIFMLIKTLDAYFQIEDAWIKMYQIIMKHLFVINSAGSLIPFVIGLRNSKHLKSAM